MSDQLNRELGVGGAVLIGLGSILGTGVFVVVGLGADMVGLQVLVAIAVGAIVATCNGLNSAQLAANYPVAGGTYEYGYRLLSPAYGFTAGWMFLLAKSASAAAAALAIARIFVEPPLNIPVAIGIIVLMTAIIVGGLKRTQLVNVIIVSVTLIALLWYIIVGLGSSEPLIKVKATSFSFFEVCALMFVGYTGYGRIATMGEEIKNPSRNIPTAMLITLVVSALLYLGVAWARLKGVANPAVWYVGEVTALLGVLLNLVLGLSRILLAMGRRNDMPPAFAKVSANNQPRNAVLGVTVLICLLIFIGDIKLAWSFSAFTVLIYYAICNYAALQLNAKQMMYSPGLGYVGIVSCLFLAVWVDWRVVIAGIAMIGLGLIWLSRRSSNIFERVHEDLA